MIPIPVHVRRSVERDDSTNRRASCCVGSRQSDLTSRRTAQQNNLIGIDSQRAGIILKKNIRGANTLDRRRKFPLEREPVNDVGHRESPSREISIHSDEILIVTASP